MADNQNKPEWIAADLLSQAEHDPLAQSILITDDAAWASKVEAAVEQQMAQLATGETVAQAWEDYGAIVLAPLVGAAAIVNQIAPEHLELAIDNPVALLPRIRNAGAVFLGRHTPEAFGDYIAGPSHVLPTSRAARFSSGLSVFDFVNRTSIIGAPAKSALLAQAADLADAEGLPAHALSLRVRL
mgnify:CR=1 FL=1